MVAACRPPIPPLASLFSVFLSFKGRPRSRETAQRINKHGRGGGVRAHPSLGLSVFFLFAVLPIFSSFRTAGAPLALVHGAHDLAALSSFYKKPFYGTWQHPLNRVCARPPSLVKFFLLYAACPIERGLR